MKNRNGLTVGECLLATVAGFTGLVIAVAICGPIDPSISNSSSSSYSPPASSSDGLDWDAARRAGFSEEDIDAAKTLHSLQQMDNDDQEDALIYNTLKELGYSDSDARHAVEASR